MHRSQGMQCIAAAIMLLVVLHGRPGHAQSPSVEAEALFRQGQELLAVSKTAEACAAFDLSQKLDPRTTTLLNQANCREQNGQLATAWALFVEAARQTRNATDAAGQHLHTVAANHAAKLEQRLSTLRIDVPPESKISGLEILRNGQVFDPAAWNRPLPIDGGSYRILARAPARIEWSSDATVATEGEAKRIEIPKLQPAKVIDRAVGRDAGGDVPVPGPPSPEPRDEGSLWTGRRKIAAGIMGGGVLALAVGGVLGTSAKAKQRDAHALCPSLRDCDAADRANELIRSGHNLAIEADVVFGIAAVAAIAAGALWFMGAPESHPRVSIVPGVWPGQLVVTGSF